MNLIPISYRLPWTHCLNGDAKFNYAKIEAVGFDDQGKPRRWCIREGSSVLGKDIVGFEYEPSPSNRDDEFLERTRFDSPEEAYECAHRYFSKQTTLTNGW